MQRQYKTLIHDDELESKLIVAADAIRRNAERRNTVTLHIQRVRSERNKVIELPASFEDEELEQEEDE